MPIQILRDTGATQSLLLAGAIDLPAPTSPSQVVLLAGLGGEFGAVALREVYLHSGLVSGLVTVGVVPSLPVEGISLLLGNDLAGAHVRVVSSEPCDVVDMQQVERISRRFSQLVYSPMPRRGPAVRGLSWTRGSQQPVWQMCFLPPFRMPKTTPV